MDYGLLITCNRNYIANNLEPAQINVFLICGVSASCQMIKNWVLKTENSIASENPDVHQKKSMEGKWIFLHRAPKKPPATSVVILSVQERIRSVLFSISRLDFCWPRFTLTRLPNRILVGDLIKFYLFYQYILGGNHLFWSLRSMFFSGRNGFRQWQNGGKHRIFFCHFRHINRIETTRDYASTLFSD